MTPFFIRNVCVQETRKDICVNIIAVEEEEFP